MSMNKLNNHLAIIVFGLAVFGCTTQAANNENGPSGEIVKLPVDVKVVRATALIQEEVLRVQFLQTGKSLSPVKFPKRLYPSISRMVVTSIRDNSSTGLMTARLKPG